MAIQYVSKSINFLGYTEEKWWDGDWGGAPWGATSWFMLYYSIS